MVNARSFLFAFKYNHKETFIIEFSHLKIRILSGKNNGEVIYQLDAPYKYVDLWDKEELCCKIQTIQNCDILYIFNEEYPVMMLKRYGNNDWRLEELELKNGPFEAMNTDGIVINCSDVSGNVELHASSDVFKETDVNRLIRLRVFDDDTKNWSANISVKINDIYVSDNKYYQALNEGNTGNIKPVHGEGYRSDGNIKWKYLHDGFGVAKICEYINSKEVKANVLSRLPEALKDGTKCWEFGIIHAGGKYPKAGVFFRNRLALLINTSNGPIVCLSFNGDYNNFADMEYGEVTAETAISVPVLSNEFNEGKWLYAGSSLFVGTGSGEFYIDAMTSSNPMSNDNVKISQISSIGSKGIAPIGIGKHIFFIDKYGLSLRDLVYNYYNDGYDQFDISILAKHLFQSRVIGMSYQEVPDKILWCLVNDGNLIAITFSDEQNICALSRHDFSGRVESLTVIPNFDKCNDELWLEVCRVVDSNNNRSIERVEQGMPLVWSESIYQSDRMSSRKELECEYVKYNAMYLDGAVLFERENGDECEEISNLSHLEGLSVSVFADGGYIGNQMVVGGKIKISKNFARVLVGLPIVSQFIPQRTYVQLENSNGLGCKQRINHVLLMLYMSGGGEIGMDEATLQNILYRRTDYEQNKVVNLFSGIKEVLFNGATNYTESGADIFIQNKSPFPMNILAIVPYMDIT